MCTHILYDPHMYTEAQTQRNKKKTHLENNVTNEEVTIYWDKHFMI